MDMMIDGIESAVRTGEDAKATGSSYTHAAQEAEHPQSSAPTPEASKSWWDSAVDTVKSAGNAVDHAVHSAGDAVNNAATSGINTATGALRDVAGNTVADAFHGVAGAVQNDVKQTAGFTYGVASGATEAVGGMAEGVGGMVQGGYKMATDSQYRGQVMQGAEHFAQQVADHPGATASALGNAAVTGGKDWIAGAGKAAQEGNLGEYLGHAAGSTAVNVGSFFVPGADAADVANIAGHVGEAANVLDHGAEAGSVLTRGAEAGSALTHGAEAGGTVEHAGQAAVTTDHAAEATHAAAAAEQNTASAAHSADEARQTEAAATRGTKRPAEDLDHVDDGGQAAKHARTDAPAEAAKPAGPITHTESATYGKNSVTWKLDEDGRPLHAEGTLKEANAGLVRGKDELAAQAKTTDRPGALPDDHAGHIVGHRFTADQGIRNLFPQNGNFNTGAYKTMENEWAAWTKNGGEVHFKVELEGGTPDRPAQVVATYDVRNPAGESVYQNRHIFDNQAAQSFTRIPSKDMTGLLK